MAQQLWFLLVAAAASQGYGLPSAVSTPLGKVAGEEKDGYRVFRGLRYSEPAKRFEVAEPKRPWTGVVDATRFGARCAGNSGPLVSEDCLFVNVWTPSPAPRQPVPVLVFIHGGGFLTGSGSDEIVWGDMAVQDRAKPLVFVTLNYRLGIFGFYSDRDGGPANFGLRDQQMALQWVRANIGSFGGDPGRVTIAGQSAGAMAVLCHLVAPGSRGLFHGAFMASAVGLHYRTLEENAPLVDSASQAVGCRNTSTQRQCLLSKPAGALSTAAVTTAYGLHFRSPCEGCDNWLPWMPIVDGSVLPRDPLDMMRDGDSARVPVVSSTLRNETGAFQPGFLLKFEDLSRAFYNAATRLAFKGSAAAIDGFYSRSPEFSRADRATRLNIALTDSLFTCYSRYVSRQLAKHSSAFISVFMHAPSPYSDPENRGVDAKCVSGATCHAADLWYIIPRSPAMMKQLGSHLTDTERALAAKYSDAIKAFVYGSSHPWVPYALSSDLSVGWGDLGPGLMQGYHSSSCDFLESTGISERLWHGRSSRATGGQAATILV